MQRLNVRQVAVTGATSGAGARLCEVLVASGVRVVGLVRDPSQRTAAHLASLGVELVRGDLGNTEALASLCRGAEVVFHTAAHVGDWGAPETFVAVNVQGTRNVVEAAASAGARRFVHLSSTAVYGRPDHGRITEEYPVRRSGQPYDDTKVDAEKVAFFRGKQLGLEVTAIRPPVIYGPYDRNFLPRAASALRTGKFLLVDGGKAPLNMVWVDHLVDVMLRAAERPSAVSEAFNVMDEIDKRPPTVREVGEAIARAIGAPAPTRSVPFGVAFALSGVVEKAFVLARASKPPPMTPFAVTILTRDVIYDASKAASLLGFSPSVGTLEGIGRQAAAFAARGD